jgi:chaperonin GroES
MSSSSITPQKSLERGCFLTYSYPAMKKKSKTQKKHKNRAKKAITSKLATLKAKNTVGMTPLGDRVLVKPQMGETTTAFGIIIPNTAKEKPETGVVVAVGPGKKTDNGSVVPVNVQVGDKVMFSKYGFDEVKLKGEEYYLIREENILAVLN